MLYNKLSCLFLDMGKRLPIASIILFVFFYTMPGFLKAEERGILLDKAKAIAHNYLRLIKLKDYESAQLLVFEISNNPKLKELDLLSKECFFEEFGEIQGFNYKEFSISEDESLILHYEIQYKDHLMVKEIMIGEKNGEYQIINASDDVALSPAAAKKMILVMKRISEGTGAGP